MQAAQRQRVRRYRGLTGPQGYLPGFCEENTLRVGPIYRIEMNSRARHLQAVNNRVCRRALHPHVAAQHGKMSQIQAFKVFRRQFRFPC